ncbi:MAG TPA: hypothetical protein VF008_02320 [Niastella sp.]
MQIIDTTEGRINLSNDFSVGKNTSAQELIQALGAEKFEAIDTSDHGTHCKIWNVKLNDQYFLFDYYFGKDHLRLISFILNDNYIVAGTWDDWSKKEELKKKGFFNKWLTAQIGTGRKFPWGIIDACYHVQGGFSHIFLNYNEA